MTKDSIYASWYDQKADTVLAMVRVREIRYKNMAKGMWLGFLIGLTPGAIIYATAGFEKKQDEDKRRVEGIWLGAVGTLVGVGFSHDAAPTDTIIFRRESGK